MRDEDTYRSYRTDRTYGRGPAFFRAIKPFFLMWKYPRMVAWFLIATALMVLAHLPFMRGEILPYYLKFNPGIVLVPLAGIFWGPAGVWAALAASLLGDRIVGMWNEVTPFRAAGHFLFAWSAQRLWGAWRAHGGYTLRHAPRWLPTFRCIFVAWPGCAIAASWIGIGSSLSGLYPFPYLATLALLHNLVFVTLLGVALYRIAAREVVPHFGTWVDVMGKDAGIPILPTASLLFLWVGCVGAYAAGCLAGGFFYRIWPLRPFVITTTCGPLVPMLVIPFLALQVIGLLGAQSARVTERVLEEEDRTERFRRILETDMTGQAPQTSPPQDGPTPEPQEEPEEAGDWPDYIEPFGRES